MHDALEGVAEHLATEFADEPCARVIRVVIDCVAEFPDQDELFIEHAARAYLNAGVDHVRRFTATPPSPRRARPRRLGVAQPSALATGAPRAV